MSVRPPRVLTRSFTLIPALFTASDPVQLLGFGLSGSLTLAYGLTRFLFVGPGFCPWRDLSALQIRLSSDSASRRTPLPLANASHCRARSGLSPYRTCAHRAHQKGRSPIREAFLFGFAVPRGEPTEQLKVQDQMLWGAGLRWRPLPKAEAPTEAAAETSE